uniref:Mediator of RNA polymerase II transcription subunit 30 n=1 Tax=Glossina pallidipes TaxID=7398 RepID=A0A1B0AAP8_GLOPL
MSGQYPGGYNNAIGGHRGQFNAQQQQQQQQMMNQLQMGGPGGMMSMGYNQGGMMQQQQQVSPMQGMSGPTSGGIGVMNPGMQSPSHVQQQLMQQQQIQMQQQQQQMGPQMGMVNQPGMSPQLRVNIIAVTHRMEYTTVESLIPFKDEPEHRLEATQCEEYRKALQENQELIDTVKLKNRQLREIIDRTRIIVWEINTMLSMRKS